MSDVITVFEGAVVKIERSSTGYGATERTVGVDVTVQSVWQETDPADGSLQPYTRSTVIHLPRGYGQPVVGDKLSVILSKGINENLTPVTDEDRTEIAELVAEEPDDEDHQDTHMPNLDAPEASEQYRSEI